MKRKYKILHVLNSMTHGGTETFLMSMLRCYKREQFQMDIMCVGRQAGEYAPEANALGANLILCRMNYDQIRFVYRLYKFLRRERYDVVNSHLEDMGGSVILAAWLARVPVRVASYHSSRIDMGFLRNIYLRIMRQIIANSAISITAPSQAVSNSFFAKMRFNHNKIHLITYGVDTAFFAQKPVRVLDLSRFGFDHNNLIVGHVGNYRPQKNHKALLRIASLVINEVPNARFIFRGAVCRGRMVSGCTKEEIDEQISVLGLSRYIAHVESLEDMRQFYSAIDVFVLPSKHEGMPISIIEAQAAGKAIVASRLPGIMLATAPQMQGNLFEIGDVESFAKCLIRLLKDKQKRKILGKAGQEYVQKERDVKIAVRKYEELYLPHDNHNN